MDNGQVCEEIRPPSNLVCSEQGQMTTVTFAYNGQPCNPKGNHQANATVCIDYYPPVTATTETLVDVYCVDYATNSHMTVTPSPLNDNTFTVTKPDNSFLPDKLRCMVTSGGRVHQDNIIDTSGKVDLELRDQFGSLTLVSCQDTTCLETMNFNITMDNIGDSPMNLNEFTYTFNGQTGNLLPNVFPNYLPPGNSTWIVKQEQINVCRPTSEQYRVEVDVQASPPNGEYCIDKDVYVVEVGPTIERPRRTPSPTFRPTAAPTPLPTPPPVCKVDVEIVCTTTNEKVCEEIRPPSNLLCTEKDQMTSVTFTYNGQPCSTTGNEQGGAAVCIDYFPPLPPGSDINVYCIDYVTNATMTVTPGLINDNTFTVTRPDNGLLPDKLRCIVTSGGTVYQDNVIDTSGEVNLELRDQFGSLTLVSCDDRTCLQTMDFNITTNNIGDSPMNMDNFTYTFNGNTENLLPNVFPNYLPPGSITWVIKQEQINVCRPTSEKYQVEVNVQA